MGNMRKIMPLTLILFLVCTLLAGCWDKSEINERAFVTAVGIDIYVKEDDKDGEESGEQDTDSRERYILTYTFPNIEAIGKQGSGDPRFVVGSVGLSPIEARWELRTRLNKVMFLQHLKALIIGEDVARNSDMLKEILDSVERNYEISRKINVLVATGEAKDIINIQSKFEEDVGMYLSGISESAGRSARFNPLTLGDLIISLHNNQNALMPSVIPGKDDIKGAGSAVIKNYMLIGWLGEIENRSAMFLKDEIKSQTIVMVTYDDIVIPYLLTESSTKQKARVEDGKIKVDFIIEMEGDLTQYKLGTSESVLDDKVLKKVETKVEVHLRKQILDMVEKIQQDYKVDVINVGDYLKKFKPSIWNTVKDDWENEFSNVDIDVKIDAKIRRIGLTK